ncbi:MAG: YihY family inner membrane protein, partial [Thermoanaerobaculia bacterium]|nr:YihY family inner membrane protein [Thermoanaerobaculia bacterium]
MKTDPSPETLTISWAPRLGLLAATRRLARFLYVSIRKAIDDELIEQSAALAFITILSLVPLLAAFSFLLEGVFQEREQRLIQILTALLPYTEQQVLGKIDQFLSEAQQIRGFGFLTFLLTALLAFTNIERSISRIWKVENKRPLRNRLLSFTLVLFWGPILVGVAYSGLYFLEQHPAFQVFAQSPPAQLVPALMTFLGLTVLYWQVPYTSVELRTAAIGGVLATLLLEGLKRGFGFYVHAFPSISLIYGSFGLALLFMISVQLSWTIVLLGSEIAYCLQHFELLLSRRLAGAQLEGRWLGLAALLVVTSRARRGQPVTPHERLAERLRLSPTDLRQALHPMVEHRLLSESSGETEGYMLSCDPYALRVDDVLELYEKVQLEVLEPLSADISRNLGHRAPALRTASVGQHGSVGCPRRPPRATAHLAENWRAIRTLYVPPRAGPPRRVSHTPRLPPARAARGQRGCGSSVDLLYGWAGRPRDVRAAHAH